MKIGQKNGGGVCSGACEETMVAWVLVCGFCFVPAYGRLTLSFKSFVPEYGHLTWSLQSVFVPFTLRAVWPVCLFLECSQVRYAFGEVCDPKAP